MKLTVHEAARKGYGTAADIYARARPAYPEAAVEWLVERLRLANGPGEIVEIGAGTGKLTVELAARGFAVVAVEPIPAMRERLIGLGDRIVAVDAVAERLPFETASVARIVASQSLHWADVELALAEFNRVLAPAGLIALVWNFRDTDVSWQADLDKLLSELRGDTPHSRDGRWERAVDGSPLAITASGSWRWAVASDLAGVIDRVRSVSYVAALSERDQATVDESVREVVRRHNLDEGTIDFPYVTEAYLLRRDSR
jgi:SAM-dependent methyltransferase